MRLISIKEYADSVNMSVQSVYSRISKGKLAYEVKDGVKMVLVNDKPKADTSKADCKAKVRNLKAQVKLLKKEIALIEANNKTAAENMQSVLKMVLEIKNISTDVIETKVVENKKGNKKNKRNKNKKGKKK